MDGGIGVVMTMPSLPMNSWGLVTIMPSASDLGLALSTPGYYIWI